MKAFNGLHDESLQYCSVRDITQFPHDRQSNHFYHGGVYITHVVCVGVLTSGRLFCADDEKMNCWVECWDFEGRRTSARVPVIVHGILQSIHGRIPVIRIKSVRISNRVEKDRWLTMCKKHHDYRLSKAPQRDFLRELYMMDEEDVSDSGFD